MSDDFTTLDGTEAAVWRRLEAAMSDPGAPARNIALATADLQGGAAVRMVVLRAADRAGGRLAIYTNALSGKVAELDADPACECLVWDAEARFQIRLRGAAEVLAGPDPVWRAMDEHERKLYAQSPGPGTEMEDAEDLADFPPTPSAELFRLVQVTLSGIETLQLARDLHRRASFVPGAEGAPWQGVWLTP